MANGNLSANDALRDLSNQLASGTFDPDAWASSGPHRTDLGRTSVTYTSRIAGSDVVVRRLRTPSGSPDSSDYFFTLSVRSEGREADQLRTDDPASKLGALVTEIERQSGLGPAIVNNNRFTTTVITAIQRGVDSGDIDASDWRADGPFDAAAADGLAFTVERGQTEVTLRRTAGSWSGSSIATDTTYSITVVRDDTVIGLALTTSQDSPLATIFNRVAKIHAARVTELQAAAAADLGM